MQQTNLLLNSTIIFTLVWLFYISVNGQGPLCPEVLSKIPNVCDRIKCFNNITEKDCPVGTIFTKKLSMCGCCPGCAKYIGLIPEKLPCSEEVSKISRDVDCSGPSCPVSLNKCLPELVCEKDTGICRLPTVKLEECTHECRYKKSLHILGLFHWNPQCEEDGSYAPKQCKGDPIDGICFCVDRCGKRVFGREWRSEAENQTCACSRYTSDLRAKGNIATFHCSPNGNFEALQCDTDSRTCFCVDEKTGRMSGAIVPEHLWEILPCFTYNVTNFEKKGRYLRKCESELAGVEQLQKEGKLHGTAVNMHLPDCDFDGSFGPKQTTGTLSQCVYKNGTRIKDYMATALADSAMDCTCARDEYFYQISARPFSYKCQLQVGNYEPVYSYGSFASCVDRDGVRYGDLVPSESVCCLLTECNSVLGTKCYQVGINPQGYKPCCYWPFGDACKENA